MQCVLGLDQQAGNKPASVMAKKNIMTNPVIQEIIAGLIWAYMMLVKYTVRWEIRGKEHIQPQWDNPGSAVLCFWHGRVVGLLAGWRLDLLRPTILISKSTDGDMITRTARNLGVRAVRGSSRNPKKDESGKGGQQALKDIIKLLKDGEAVVVTPDGPRGPRYRAKPGAATAAVDTNTHAIVCGFAVKGMKALGSWDRQVLVWPFSKGVFVWGPIIPVPETGTRQEKIDLMRQQIEDSLIAINREADEACGLTPIEPDPPYDPDAPKPGKAG